MDVGQTDINSLTSHETRLKQRRNISGRPASIATPNNVGYSPYQDERRGSNGSSASTMTSPSVPHRWMPPQVTPHVVPSLPPINQHAFVYNSYHERHVVTIAESQPPTFPPTAVYSDVAGLAHAQHQTIDLPSPISPGESRGKNVDKPASIGPASGEKRQSLACGLWCQRKVCSL